MTQKSRFWGLLRNQQEERTERSRGRRRHIGLLAGLLGLASGLILVSGLSLSLSCGVPGDRAEFGCPWGEECSPETPGGLYFNGRSFSDGWHSPYDEPEKLPLTAVDGIQTFTLDPVDSFVDLGDYTADCSEEIFMAVQVDPDEMTVSVLAVEEGTAKLRILEEGTEALFDRISIYSANTSMLELAPLVGDVDEETPPEEWPLLYGGAATTWIARLWSGDERLVDERTVIVSGDATSIESVTPAKWDTADVKPAEGVTTITVKVSVGSMLQAFASADVTFEADEIVVFELPSTVEQGSMEFVSFKAYLQGRRVANAISSITVTKPDQTTEDILIFNEGDTYWRIAYGKLVAEQLGVHTISIQAADITEEYEYTVVPAPAPLLPMEPDKPEFSWHGRFWRTPVMPIHGVVFGTPGERADTSAENSNQTIETRQ